MSTPDHGRACPAVLAVGECMIEVRHRSPAVADVGVAGDTYNTAVYLLRTARLLGRSPDVGYLTGLGDDVYSDQIRSAWLQESVSDRSTTLPGRRPGLYAVRTSAAGERSFTYWREDSAAAELLRGVDWVGRVEADHVHYSGITLQLMSEESRGRFLEQLVRLRRHGTRVSFDTNYRPAGWARRGGSGPIPTVGDVFDEAARGADVVFTGLDDEQLLRGSADPQRAVGHYQGLGVEELLVKSGAGGVLLTTGGARIHRAPVAGVTVVDTTAAGDSLAGGYLAGRLAGRSPAEALELGTAVAAQVIRWPGAIVPRGEFVLPVPA